MRYYLRQVAIIGMFCSGIASYGIYKWLTANKLPSGVTCYTGTFPTLIPVQ